MRLKKLIPMLALGVIYGASAQESLSNKYLRPQTAAVYPYMSNYIINEARLPLYLPEVEGYTLLKCDLHLHTVFSDASVWPTTRVEEAFREGLDAIALTDHFEFRFINRADVNTDNFMREYEIAKTTADELGVLLVPGLEVTREVPTGHFNILFINDPSPLAKYINKENPRDPSNIADILSAGKELGGFITWNHPAYQKPNGAEWTSIHQSLYEKGLIMGIEIINSNLYVPLVHQWAEEKNLTKMSNTDWHSNFRIRDGYHRAMTIVFSKDRSVDGIKEALLNRRTIGYAANYLYGAQELVEPIFKKSLKTRVISSSEKKISVEVRNISGLPYELSVEEDEFYTPSRTNKEITIYPNETIAISLDIKAKEKKGEIHVTVNNLHIKANVPLQTSIPFFVK